MTLDFERIQAICFDFDGTLAHFQGDFLKLSWNTLNSLGLAEAHFEDCMKEFNIQQFREGASDLPGILRAVLEVLELKTSADIDTVARTMTDAYISEIHLLPGARELLEQLPYPLAIITNGPSDMQQQAIDTVKLKNYFKTVIVSGDADVAVRKPNPRIFEIACKRLNTHPEHCLMIGDNLGADVLGAVKFGMQGIYISSQDQASEDVVTVEDTKALSKLLLNG